MDIFNQAIVSSHKKRVAIKLPFLDILILLTYSFLLPTLIAANPVANNNTLIGSGIGLGV